MVMFLFSDASLFGASYIKPGNGQLPYRKREISLLIKVNEDIL